MSNALTRRLGLSEREAAKIAKAVGPIKSVVEFFEDALHALEKAKVPEAVAHAVPWLGFAAHLAPGVPVVVFLLKLLGKLTNETDPEALGYLAATMAYERSVEQAVRALGAPKKPKELTADMRQAYETLRPAEDMSFASLSFAGALQHPFVREADGFLDIFAGAAGYDKAERRRLFAEVHSRFVVNLKTLLSQAPLKEKFAPFLDRLELGAEELRAYDALFEHADLQRRLFEDAKVLGTEPFSLAEVYVDLDCGSLTWAEIRDGKGPGVDRGDRPKPVDPFSEASGGRSPLLATVMDRLGDPNFADAIVIQGVAGAGKSAFTLRLATELIHEGLRPIRVRMRDLPFDRHAVDGIQRAVKVSDESHTSSAPDAFLADGSRPHTAEAPPDLFLKNAIFAEEVTFRAARICPYVLILDGWDEISVSVTEGFRARLDRMLEQVRSEFLSNRTVPVRVIVTGRPTTALTEGSFLRDKTQILTVRPFRPDQLDTFLKSLAEALKRPLDEGADGRRWNLDLKRYRPVLAQYRRSFTTKPDARTDSSARGSMDVLGLPLLAHIAVRLMASYEGPLAELIETPTTLYRSLVDLTAERAGQVGNLALDPSARPRLAGTRLRSLLRRTAAAIFVHGEESISYVELTRRLRLEGDDLVTKAEEATSDNMLATLMVSFYFKGGHRELGCEFVHKSFREYLFAEAIVETLKEYGRGKRGELPRRSPAWQDFGDDGRLELSRTLGELCAPQWLSVEVASHVERLIEWEIKRAFAPESSDSVRSRPSGGKRADQAFALGRPTEPLDQKRWEIVRDALADLWDWWCDGVPLRPQPRRGERGAFSLGPAYAEKLVDWAAPQAVTWGDARLVPARTSTVDAHLGDALFRLTAAVHYHLALADGWTDRATRPADLWAGVGDPGNGGRACQSQIKDGTSRWILFAPSRNDTDLFASATLRINAEGFRPGGPFPLGVDARGVDLRGASFHIPNPQTPPRKSLFRHANLRGITAVGSCFYAAELDSVLLREAILDRAELAHVVLDGSDLSDASLVRADLGRAHLDGADLRRADLEGANLSRAVLGHADLRGAVLRFAKLDEAELGRAKMDGAAVIAVATPAPADAGPRPS